MNTNTPTRSKAGRPSFKIDGKRLRQIRESKGLTQEQMMLRIKQHLGQDTRNTSSETLKTSYRRWEKSGHVPAKTAKAIAHVLNVTVAVLQGQAPEAASSRLDAIAERVQQRLGEGHQALQEMLDAEAAAERRTLHIAMDGNTPPQQDANATHQQNLRFIAERLTQRLEYAQLSQDKGELEEISGLLGYSQHEIQQPVSEDGLWLLLQDGAAADQPRFFHSVNALVSSAKDTIRQHLQSAPCDSRVTFRQEGAWFRLQIFNPHWKEDSAIQVRLSFVRGQASETGLQWTQPSWLDEISLRDFQHSLCSYSNYVQGLDSHENGPSYNLGDLKLAIYRHPSRDEFEKDGWGVRDKLISICDTWRKQTEVREKASADLTEVEIEDYLEDLENMLMRHAEYGNAHDVVTQRLCSHLLECMQPLLAEWPLKYWKFKAHQSCIAIELNAPLWLAQQKKTTDFYGSKYYIYLVEQAAQQEARHVPWRSKSIEEAVDRIQRDFEETLASLEIGPPLSHHLNIRQ